MIPEELNRGQRYAMLRYATPCCAALRRLLSLPDVEQFQGIEQGPLLHIIINPLIGAEARSAIDLQRSTRE